MAIWKSEQMYFEARSLADYFPKLIPREPDFDRYELDDAFAVAFALDTADAWYDFALMDFLP